MAADAARSPRTGEPCCCGGPTARSGCSTVRASGPARSASGALVRTVWARTTGIAGPASFLVAALLSGKLEGGPAQPPRRNRRREASTELFGPGRDGCRRRGSCSTSTRRTTRCTAARRAAPSTATTATTASCRSSGKHPLCAVLRPGNRRRFGREHRSARPHRRPAAPPVAASWTPPKKLPGPTAWSHRRRPQRPARPENRAGTPRRPGRVAGPPPPGPHLRGVRPTRRSWSRSRRVIGPSICRASTPASSSPRSRRPSPPGPSTSRVLPPGHAENAIKEQQLDLFADRTSATR